MKKRTGLLTVLTVLLLAVALLVTGCSGKKAEADAKKASVSTSTEKLPRMVDFWAPHCPPCRQMMPELEELQEEYAHAFNLVKINTSLPENQLAAHQNQIKYIPTQIFYDEKGTQLFRHVGYMSKQDILDKWEELGYPMKAKD